MSVMVLTRTFSTRQRDLRLICRSTRGGGGAGSQSFDNPGSFEESWVVRLALTYLHHRSLITVHHQYHWSRSFPSLGI